MERVVLKSWNELPICDTLLVVMGGVPNEDVFDHNVRRVLRLRPECNPVKELNEALGSSVGFLVETEIQAKTLEFRLFQVQTRRTVQVIVAPTMQKEDNSAGDD